MQKNGDMMLLLAHLLNLNTEWRQAKLRLRTIVSSEDEQNPMNEKLNINFGGRLFRRKGEFPLRPSQSSVIYQRNRRDRDIFGGIDYSFSMTAVLSLDGGLSDDPDYQGYWESAGYNNDGDLDGPIFEDKD